MVAMFVTLDAQYMTVLCLRIKSHLLYYNALLTTGIEQKDV
jgi:hypothetical protein